MSVSAAVRIAQVYVHYIFRQSNATYLENVVHVLIERYVCIYS